MRVWTLMDNAFEVEQKLELAYAAFRSFRTSSLESRAEKLRMAAEILESESTPLAEIMTAEMGKTLESAKAEANKCALVCRYYADHGAEFLADEQYAVQ